MASNGPKQGVLNSARSSRSSIQSHDLKSCGELEWERCEGYKWWGVRPSILVPILVPMQGCWVKLDRFPSISGLSSGEGRNGDGADWCLQTRHSGSALSICSLSKAWVRVQEGVGVVAHVLIWVLCLQKQMDFCGFEARLLYIKPYLKKERNEGG